MRSIKTILYSTRFARAMKSLPVEMRDEVKKREAIFRRNCFDPRLKTHKLKGKHQDLWSFSITYKHRMLFRFVSDDIVYFLDVGDHSIYQ